MHVLILTSDRFTFLWTNGFNFTSKNNPIYGLYHDCFEQCKIGGQTFSHSWNERILYFIKRYDMSGSKDPLPEDTSGHFIGQVWMGFKFLFSFHLEYYKLVLNVQMNLSCSIGFFCFKVMHLNLLLYFLRIMYALFFLPNIFWERVYNLT